MTIINKIVDVKSDFNPAAVSVTGDKSPTTGRCPVYEGIPEERKRVYRSIYGLVWSGAALMMMKMMLLLLMLTMPRGLRVSACPDSAPASDDSHHGSGARVSRTRLFFTSLKSSRVVRSISILLFLYTVESKRDPLTIKSYHQVQTCLVRKV